MAERTGNGTAHWKVYFLYPALAAALSGIVILALAYKFVYLRQIEQTERQITQNDESQRKQLQELKDTNAQDRAILQDALEANKGQLELTRSSLELIKQEAAEEKARADASEKRLEELQTRWRSARGSYSGEMRGLLGNMYPEKMTPPELRALAVKITSARTSVLVRIEDMRSILQRIVDLLDSDMDDLSKEINSPQLNSNRIRELLERISKKFEHNMTILDEQVELLLQKAGCPTQAASALP